MEDFSISNNPEYKIPEEFSISSYELADNLTEKVFEEEQKLDGPKKLGEAKKFRERIIELEPHVGSLRKFFQQSKKSKASDKECKTEEKKDTKISLQENLLRGLLALPIGVSIHELGHAAQASSVGCKTFVDPMPKIVEGKTFLGSTTWRGNMDKGQEAAFNIAGVRNTKLLSKVVLECLRNNKELTPKQKSFLAMFGLFGGTDFARYTLLGSSSHRGHDITNFSRNTGIKYNVLKGLAGLDLLFNRKQYKYFWDTMWGKDVEPPPQSDWDIYFGYKALPLPGSPGVGSIGIQHRF